MYMCSYTCRHTTATCSADLTDLEMEMRMYVHEIMIGDRVVCACLRVLWEYVRLCTRLI